MQLSAIDGWIGIVEVLIYVLGSGGAALAAAKITSRYARHEGQQMRDQVLAISDQVVNGHTGQPPMRADLDEIRAAVHDIRADQAEMRMDVRELRDALRIERDDIMELQDRVASLAPRKRPRRDPA
jgi:septation ring formation regulator EzrA